MFFQRIRSKMMFSRDLKEYKKLNRTKFNVEKRNLYPILDDRNKDAGSVDTHYFLQDIWMAKKVLDDNPQKHYDIGSRIDGFIAHLLSSRKNVIQIDIRPFPHSVEGLEFICADATNLEQIEDESIDSMSSLHAVEHFGLGRYGDPIDPEACFKAMKAFMRVLKTEGKLYISVPVGKEDKVYFNAHRVFNPYTILKCFDELQLEEFAFIKDYRVNQIDILHCDKKELAKEIGEYSCGMFIFKKK